MTRLRLEVLGVAGPAARLTDAAVPGATPDWSATAQAGIAAGEYALQVDGAGYVGPAPAE